jgi:peptidase M28-like protein
MPATQTAAQLTEFARRGAGTNSERLAAAWLRDEAESGRREATIETFWCRPNWALAHSWHLLLGIAGSLVMVSNPTLGGGLVLAGLICILAEWFTGRSPGRRLTPEHASQNVVSRPPAASPPPGGTNGAGSEAGGDERLHLIVTANYDAGRAGLIHRPWLRRATGLPRRLAGDGRFIPGWLGWIAIAHVWLLAVAVVRLGSSETTSAAVGALQLIPTVVLVLTLALLLESAAADFGPAGADNAAGTAVALGLIRTLDTAPPRRLAVELVLQGAGDGQMIGLAHHLRVRRKELTRANTIVLGIGPVGAGQPHWWTGDGPLVPLRYHPRLRDLAARLADPASGLDARPYRGRGTAPALPARFRGLPAINLGSLDAQGFAAGSHTAQDTAETLDPGTVDELLQFVLILVEGIDAELVARTPTAAIEPTTAGHL